MYDILLFDLDDTLLDFHRAEAQALQETLESLGIASSPQAVAAYREINGAMWRRLEEGTIAREELKWRRFAILFSQMGIKASAHQATAQYESRLKEKAYFLPGARELLEQLKGTCRLYLVTNGNLLVQENRIKKAGIAGYFNDIFISQQVGYEKPHLEFFLACFRRIENFSLSRTMIIGDSLTSDIRGGAGAGICTCWFHPDERPKPSDLKPDYEIKDLLELPEILRGKEKEKR